MLKDRHPLIQKCKLSERAMRRSDLMRMGAGKMAMTTLMKLTTYIYYNAVFVCHEKSSLSPSQLSAGGAKRDGR